MKLSEAEHLLEIYELSEIFELNDLTEAEVLVYLINSGYMSTPEVSPLEFDE